MPHSSGLSFRSIDLHVHTGASGDYKEAAPSAAAVVARALAKGLAAIAVTDHQTANAVDDVVAAGKAAGLVVFPGVELNVTGGEEGVHINVIFDVDKNRENIHQFLNKLGIYSKDGKPTSPAADVTVGKVSDELSIYDPSAIVILAHCHSSKGVTGDMKGSTRTHIFLTHRKNIMAAEASEHDFLNAEKKAKRKRLIDIFDGTDKDYHFRRLAVIQASDAHALEEIGSACSLFKVDTPITIEDLRQCFIDRDTRIRQPFEFASTTYPRIVDLTVSDGFLKDQELTFHEGLNSILGAKGSGKSLAIEALRFALGQSPGLSPIKEDHFSKLEKCVKPYGVVHVTILDDSGKRYRVSRTYNPAAGHPTVITDLTDGSSKAFSVAEVFPVLFLSQNEIVRIAEEPTGASLRGFIDKFFDFHHHKHQIAQVTSELEAIDRRVAEGMRAHLGLTAANQKAATVREEIERLNRQLTNPTFEKFTKAETVGRALTHQADFIESVAVDVEGFEGSYADREVPHDDDPLVEDEPAVKRSIEFSKAAIDAVKTHLAPVKAQVRAELDKALGEYKSWEAEFAPTRTEYEQLVKDTRGNQVALDQRRRKLVIDLAALEREITNTSSRAQALRTTLEARSEILKRLDAAHKAYFEERADRCKYFTEQSQGSIEVTIAGGRDVSQFRDKLLALKRGSWLKEDDIDLIVRSITARDLLAAALKFEYRARADRTMLFELALAKNLKPETLERLVRHLVESLSLEELLGLIYETAPQDVPEVKYDVNGEKKPLSELSVGQKASALLVIGLSDGRFPIVIDQPEDSLDLRSIWTDVCGALRGAKDRRQFVFTTHNSSVAVASDSDKFTILEAGSTQAKVLHSGSMNSADIRAEVIAYLEGGPETYEKKRTKYNL